VREVSAESLGSLMLISWIRIDVVIFNSGYTCGFRTLYTKKHAIVGKTNLEPHPVFLNLFLYAVQITFGKNSVADAFIRINKNNFSEVAIYSLCGPLENCTVGQADCPGNTRPNTMPN